MNQSTLGSMLLRKEGADNIVVQVTERYEFRRFVQLLEQKAASSGRSMLYVHFSENPVLDLTRGGLETVEIPLNHRFETFTVRVYEEIRRQKPGRILVFDPLSDLQTAWATDLMMENFFRVITPAVHRAGACAFFPLIRSMHAFEAVAEVRELSDIFVDLYSDFRDFYLRVQKADGLTSGPLFLPHILNQTTGEFEPIVDGVKTSRFHQARNRGTGRGRSQHMDSWDRFFYEAQRSYEEGRDMTEICARMCNIMMSRDEKMRTLIRKHYEPQDYFFVREHMVGTGLIGGKACGMLTARKIIENERPDIYEKLEPHDSFFIGSDVFYTYIVENGLWDLRVRQRTEEGYFALADELHEALLHGTFSEAIEDDLRRLLDYYGQSPVIVRSSSILEDGFGNAFAGKYDSVFCANEGSAKERLAEFENAIRAVYASTMSISALDYRKRRGLNARDEQMALLVQRVSGSHYTDSAPVPSGSVAAAGGAHPGAAAAENFFMPCAAGVGYSYSTYRFLPDLDPSAGMLRLVMGLGTAAVDRTEGSYPRLVSLDRPKALSFTSQAEHHRYSQQNVELINKNTRRLEKLPLLRVERSLPRYMKQLLLEHDWDAERRFSDRGISRDVLFISCRGLVENEQLMADMRDLLHTIDEEYGCPVDIEFTMNVSEDGDYVINLLQCRPLQAFHDTGHASLPADPDPAEVLIDVTHASMGNSQKTEMDAVIYVDPVGYYELPYNEKSRIGTIIGKVNWHFRDQGKKLMLMVPGRIGTSSPELGVPVTFADISEMNAIFEIAESRAGYSPELSYGSHIFQDLVESEILYTAIFEDERTRAFHPKILLGAENHITEVCPEAESYRQLVHLVYPGAGQCVLYHDLAKEHLLCLWKRRTS